MNSLVKYEAARSALAHCATVDEAKDIRDKAEALRAYGRQRNDKELELWAAEIKVRANRRIGQISRELEKTKPGTVAGGKRGGTFEGPASGLSKIDALASAGLTKQAANKCEKIASISEKIFETVIAEAKSRGVPVNSTQLLAAVKKAAVVRSAPEPQVVSDECRFTGFLESLIEKGEKFKTIYADPPWQYDNQGTRASTDNHYRTMTIADLVELPVRTLAEEQSHLWLWTTNAFLFECPKLFEAWGFEFKSSFVWVKPQMGIGNYLRNSHELLLLAVRGGLVGAAKDVKSWGEYKRTKHSAKPESIRKDIVEKVSPGPRLELFGRSIVTGWTVYGNEVERTMCDIDAKEVA